MNNILVLTKNRLKLITNNKVLWALFVFVLLFFGAILNVLITEMESNSKIPIAVINKDENNLSSELLDNLRTEPSLYIRETNYNDAMDLLEDGKIEAIFIINDDYTQKVSNGETSELIEVLHLENSWAGKALSDIVASNFLKEICVNRSLLEFRRLVNKSGTFTEDDKKGYLLYSEELQSSGVFDFTIDSRIIDIGNQTENISIDNTIIYKKVIISLVATFIAFIILFAATSIMKDKELGLYKRLYSINGNRLLYILSDFVSLFIVGSVISISMASLMYYKLAIDNYNQYIQMIIIFELYVISICLLILLLTSILKKVSELQVVGSIVLIVFGIVGSSSWNLGFVNSSVSDLAKTLPNYWFIEGFTEVLMNKQYFITSNIISFIIISCVIGMLIAITSKLNKIRSI